MARRVAGLMGAARLHAPGAAAAGALDRRRRRAGAAPSRAHLRRAAPLACSGAAGAGAGRDSKTAAGGGGDDGCEEEKERALCAVIASGEATAQDDGPKSDDLPDKPKPRRFSPGVAALALLIFAALAAADAGVLQTDLSHLPGWRDVAAMLDTAVHRELQVLYMPALNAAMRLGMLALVRLALEPVARAIYTRVFGAEKSWGDSFVRKLVVAAQAPAEVVLLVSAACALLEHIVGPLLLLQPALVRTLTNRVTTLSLVLAMGRVFFVWKEQRRSEAIWQAEIAGQSEDQIPKISTIDQLLSALIVALTAVLSMQALGFDVNSLLALGGIGGVVVGLAGRDISENLLSGLMVLTTRPFSSGDIVRFYGPNRREVHGIVQEVGWYRSTIRSFDYEVFVVPNSVFTSAVVLNISRRGRTFRFQDNFWVAAEDVLKVDAVVKDFRAYLRNSDVVIQSGPNMHRRCFIYDIKPEAVLVYVSCYIAAANRDAFLNSKEQLLLAFVRCMQNRDVRFASPPKVALIGDPMALPSPIDAQRGMSVPSAAGSEGGGGDVPTRLAAEDAAAQQARGTGTGIAALGGAAFLAASELGGEQPSAG